MSQQQQIPIWLDCDTGHDDAYAILLAAHHPKSILLGLSAVHGNAPVSKTYPNSFAVLHALNRATIPITQGSDRPLSRKPQFAGSIHGESGLGGVHLLPSVTPPPWGTTPLDQRIQLIADTLLSHPKGTPWIVATGPLTNIAMLFRQHPQVVTHIAGLSIMGGAVGGGFTNAPLGTVRGEGERFGNWSPWAEFNIVSDPEAAREIFENPVLQDRGNISMAGLDLTHLVRATAPVKDKLFPPGAELSRVRAMFKQTIEFFAGTYASAFGITDGPPLHDPLAVYAVLEPEKFLDNDGERFDVSIVIEDASTNRYLNHTGQTVLSPKAKGAVGVRVPRGVDLDAFWTTVDEALAKAETSDPHS